MAQVQDLNNYKRKKKRLGSVVRTVIISIAIVFLVGNLAFSQGWINESLFKNLVTKPDGFPVSINGSTPQNIFSLSKHIMLLTDTEVVFYDKYGEISSQTGHNSSHPHVVTKNDMALIYDKGYNNFQIQNKNGTVYTSSVSNKITNADLADNGSYAISTTSTRFLSEMYVYNKNNSEICYWKAVNGYINGMSFSKNSKKLTVGSIYAENGYFKSSIRLFDLNKEQDPVVFEKAFEDRLILGIQYLDNSSILVIFDNSYVILDEKGNIIKEYEFKSNELYYQETFSDGAILTFKDKSGKLHIRKVYSDGNFKTFSIKETDFKSLAYSENSIYILNEKDIVEYNLDGTFSTKATDMPENFEIVYKDGHIYTLNFTEINEY